MMKKRMTDTRHDLMAAGAAALLLLAVSCNSNPGPDSISSHTPLPSGTAGSNCGTCHSSANDPALDPLVTNGAGASGKHTVHVTQRGITCDRCHADYIQSQTHANGTFDTGDPAAHLVKFNISFTGGQWIDDTGPGTGRCSTSCHGPDTPEWYGGAWAMPAACTTCHASSFSTALDPAVTNGSGSSGKHVPHVTDRNLPCARCHLNYPADISHMNGQFDTGDPSVLLTRFDTVNPAGAWTQDTGPFTGRCSTLACHGGDVLDWYGLAGWTLPACSVCHNAVVGSRRQVFGAGGDFALNLSNKSHHVSGLNDPTTGQCLVCHDVSAHMEGLVRLKHADTGGVLAYSSSANTETFCLSCHDALGANGNMSPFADGSTLGTAPYRASVEIETHWNKTRGHRRQGLTCVGNGNRDTGCHLNAHGSQYVGILAKNLTLPAITPPYITAHESNYDLCFSCHENYPRVTKEAILGVRAGSLYDNDHSKGGTNRPPYYIPEISTFFRDLNAQGSGQAYDNPTMFSPAYVNLHYYHLQAGIWSYREVAPSGIHCLSCHSVHGSETQWGWLHDAMMFDHVPGVAPDEYGIMNVPMISLNNFPMSCGGFNCHQFFGTTHSWFTPLAEIATRFPGTNEIGTTGWTDPDNAHAQDAVYATASPAENSTIDSLWGNFGFDALIPPTIVRINRVQIIARYKVDTNASLATLYAQATVGGTNCPAAPLANAAEPLADTDVAFNITSCKAWTRDDLLDANFKVRIGANRGVSLNPVTFSLDSVKVQVRYHY